MSDTALPSSDGLAQLYRQFFEPPGTQRFPEKFQKELTEVCAAIYGVLLRDGGDAIDLGANHGFHTLRLHKSIGTARGRVVAVEGNQPLAERLRGLVAGDSRVTVLHKAVVAVPAETVTFTTSKKYKALGSVVPDYIKDRFPQNYADAELETHVIEAITLDQLIETYDLDALRFVKCDVEGTDFEVMNSTQLVFQRRAAACFEMNYSAASDRISGRLLEKILHHNYHVYDCFMNRLTPTTWHIPKRCPIDRFLLPAETGAAVLQQIGTAVAARWADYRSRM